MRLIFKSHVFQIQYLNFWQLLGNYYTDFNARILAKRMAHQGIAYRIVAEKIEERVNKFPWKKTEIKSTISNYVNTLPREIIDNIKTNNLIRKELIFSACCW